MYHYLCSYSTRFRFSSSYLSNILTCFLQGEVAYVAQQAWIQNLTVRDNILFGEPLDVCKYQDTVEACELKEDFEMLPASDETEIGERVSKKLLLNE